MKEKGTSYSQLRRDFFQKYKLMIVPLVQKYESSRKLRLVFAIVLSGIFFILGSLLVILCILEKDFSKGITQAIFIFYSLSWPSWHLIKKFFESSIKNKIMPFVCSCFGNMRWTDLPYLGDDKLFYRAGIVPQFTSHDYDDIFTGSYKNVNFEILEAEYEIGSGKSRQTVFKGVIIKLDMNKQFKSHTVIKPDNLINISPLPNLHHTQLEDTQFNKKFDVYTNDEIEARVLITPAFMERLKNMKVAFGSSGISCAFYEQYLIIALKTNKDLFSICSLIKPIDDRQKYKQMYEEILSIIKLIDYFKLDKK